MASVRRIFCFFGIILTDKSGMCVQGYFIRARSLPRFWYYSFHWMDYQACSPYSYLSARLPKRFPRLSLSRYEKLIPVFN